MRDESAGLRILAGPQGAANAAAERLPLAAPARALALDRLDADALPDLAAATAAGIELFFGVGRVPGANGAERTRVARRLAVAAESIATGDFARAAGGYRRELAWIDGAGELVVAEIEREGGDLLATRVRSRLGSATDGGALRLVPANLNSAGLDQLVALADGRAPRILQPELPSTQRAAGFDRLELDGPAVVAALALRLNRDPFSDLVLLVEDQAEPIVVESAPASIYTVNVEGNAGDCNGGDNLCTTDAGGGCGTGGCTLRAAIQQANIQAGADAIEFAIGASGSAHLLGSESEAIVESLTLDATTQPGYAGAPLIHVFYWGAGAAFTCQGASYTVRGFGVTGPGAGVHLAAGSTNSFFEGNRFGPAMAQPALAGPVVNFTGGSATATIGGASVAARNLFFGDSGTYGYLGGADHVVRGNRFGLNAAGGFDSSNDNSLVVYGSSGFDVLDNVVAGAANPAFLRDALRISGGSGAVVQGNFVGTDASGNADPGGFGNGVVADWGGSELSNLTFGGSAPGQGNVVAGNTVDGLTIRTQLGGIVVRGNRIGVGADGTTALGNGGVGLRVGNGSSTSIAVGGTGAGEGNLVAHSGAAGVQVQDGWNHHIRGNSIFENGGLGIDLTSQGNGTGVSPNDIGDADGGDWSGHGNKYQNFPVLAAAGGTKVAGGLNSIAGQTFALDFYSAPSCDASGHGEARVYLGSVQVSTNASGCAPFSAAVAAVANGAAVSATATDSSGSTSEISACWTADSTALFLDDFESGVLCAWSTVLP